MYLNVLCCHYFLNASAYQKFKITLCVIFIIILKYHYISHTCTVLFRNQFNSKNDSRCGLLKLANHFVNHNLCHQCAVR